MHILGIVYIVNSQSNYYLESISSCGVQYLIDHYYFLGLKAVEELESFVSLYNEFSNNLIADESPEVKLLVQKIKESMG